MDDRHLSRYAVQLVEEAEKRGIVLRLLGAAACAIHCPAHSSFQDRARRHLKDLDYVGLFKQSTAIQRFFEDRGFERDIETAVLYARSRLIFTQPRSGLHADVFLDKLHFCHVVPLVGRLEADHPTIPLAELLLTKLQIVQLNEKDVVDTLMLMREHPLGRGDEETIDVDRISALCAGDWGLWRTATINLRKVAGLCQRYTWLSAEDRSVIVERVHRLLEAIDAAPKSVAWRIRDKIGERIRWYDEVTEVRR